MKKIFPAFLLLILTMISCSNEKPYTIHGSIELPDSLMIGDTLLAAPSLEGWQVYMLDLDGQALDSVEIADNQFQFEGKVNKNDPFFVYIANDLCVGMIAIEPGDINVVIDAESLTATGTSTNDLMTDLDASLLNLQQDTYAKMAEITEEHGDAMSDSLLMPIYQDYMSQYTMLIDSFYNVSTGNLSGVYCVNVLTAHAESSDALLEAISNYPEEIQNSQLIQTRLNYLRSIEAYYQMMNDGQINDTTSFNLDELMHDAAVNAGIAE